MNNEKFAFRKAIRKIAAIGAGIGMLGATLTGAAGVSLDTYPDPFVMDYQMNSLVVIGVKAQTPDVIGAANVLASLQRASADPVDLQRSPRASGSLALSGDYVEIGDASDLLEIGERIGDVRETVTEFELDALKGGVITTDQGSTEYNQYLRFRETNPSIQGLRVIYGENDERNEKVGDFLFAEESSSNLTFAMFEYELEFEEGLESEIELFAGTNIRGQLEDLEDEVFNILGVDYTFVDSEINIVTRRVTLEFLGGDITDTMEEGEIRTYTIDGVDYEVEVVIISDSGRGTQEDTVKFKVNGEVTDELEDGETDIMSDGLEIGIREILPNEAEEVAGGDLVEFFLGANKIEITDVYNNDVYEQGVEVTEEDIEEGWVQIKGQLIDVNNTFDLASIKYRLLGDARSGESDIFVPPGHGLREYLDEPEGMLNPNWDIRYEGLMDTGVTTLIIDSNGDDEYNLKFTNRQGNDYNVPLVDNSGSQNWGFKLGEDMDANSRNDLIFVEGFVNTTNITTGQWLGGVARQRFRNIFNIRDDDYFILSDMDNDWDETSNSHVLRYESIDTTNKELTFEDLATGTVEITYEKILDNQTANGSVASNNATFAGRGELVLGGNTYLVYVANDTLGNDAFSLAVDQNSDGDVGRLRMGVTYTVNNLEVNPLERAKITIDGGGIVDLGGCNSTRGEYPVFTGMDNLSRNNRSLGSAYDNTSAGSLTIQQLVLANNTAINASNGHYHYYQDNTINESFTIALHTESSEFDENDGDEVVCIAIQEKASNEVGMRVIEEVFRIDQANSTDVTLAFAQPDSGAGLAVRMLLDAQNETAFDASNGINPVYDFELNEPDENEDFNMGMTQYGILFSVFDENTADEPEELTIEYPLVQRGVHVFVVAGDVSAKKYGGEGAVIINPIDVGATLLDTEVADIKAQNAIVVGGPCVNTAAAELLGNAEDCTEGFKEGEAMIKLFDHGNGKVALLVAGYSADDTRVATNVLSQYDRFALSGMEVKVNTQTETVTTVA